ncbi:family 1 carbohydrate esterase [Xylaria flabelliformis]|nr:family 1 carbohydrate esterase [Xylaria flabelliformis]
MKMLAPIQLLPLSVTALLAGAGASAVRPRAIASVGCGQSHDFVGSTQTFSIASSGGTRSYRIHLPSSYKINTPMPLIIAYHGSGDNPTNFEKTTRFSDGSVNPNMVTVYPQGVNGNWEGPTYATAGVSDKVFTTDLVNHIKDQYCIDTARVYATGHSNGGGFVGTLACSPDHGGQFAAFASVSGAFYTDVNGNDNCHPARSPLPMLESHGTADPTIPYNGGSGRGGPLPAIPEWLSRWAGRDQCGSMTTTDLANGVHHQVWNCAGADGLLQHYKIDGHDHSWPGPGSEIDISPVIIGFLSKQHTP